jgi:hypothetical protein
MRTGGTLVSWRGSIPDQKLIELERRWDTLGVIGLACVIIGILLQGAGVWDSIAGANKNLAESRHRGPWLSDAKTLSNNLLMCQQYPKNYLA